MDLDLANRSPGRRAKPASALALLVIVLGLSVACGPSDEDVVQAAEESISGLARVAVNNLRCSVAEAMTEGNQATDTMERYSSMMEELTDSLDSEGIASNREKMRLIDEMNDLRKDWEEELEEIGCEITDARGRSSVYPGLFSGPRAG